MRDRNWHEETVFAAPAKLAPTNPMPSPKKKGLLSSKLNRWILVIIGVLLVALAVCIFFLVRELTKTGWEINDDHTRCYYVSGERVTGMRTIDGQRYYFSNDGTMQTGMQTVGGERYCFASDGTMQTGFQDVGSERYYFADNGVMQTGFQDIADEWYYFDDDGVMQTDLQEIEGRLCYFADSGQALRGWQEIRGNTYYFMPSGEPYAAIGKWEIANDYYYFHDNGRVATGQVTLDDGRIYHFDNNGRFEHCVVMEQCISYDISADARSFPAATGTVGYYYQVLHEPMRECVGIDGTFTIDKIQNGSPDGKWAVYLRLTSGEWKQVKIFTVSNQEGSFYVDFDTPVSFDAYAYSMYQPAYAGGWYGSFYPYMDCEYLQYNFGSHQ